MRVEATLGFGGNLGDPVAAFAAALRRLERHPAIGAVVASSVYRTAPWGKLDQPEFLNMAAAIETSLTARDLLALCLQIEREGGRERGERWGPRTIDIDVLTYGDDTIDEPGLQVPHPRIVDRAFVLAPLAEIAPRRTVGDRTVHELWAASGSQGVRQDAEASQRLQAIMLAGDPSGPGR